MSEERRERLREALADLLEEGEAYVVARREGKVTVEEPTDEVASPLRERDPKLFGYLSQMNARVDAATGGGLLLTVLLLAVAACVALYVYVPELRDWWAYTLVLAAGVGLWHFVNDRFERATYEDIRAEIHQRIAASRWSREELVALLAGDPETETLLPHLKRDDGT